ncbi:MAG: hypothetical protein IPH82_26765 [Chloroflexi bacterium]|nr:hypothetical protein [Chloroflexota bacterium]
MAEGSDVCLDAPLTAVQADLPIHKPLTALTTIAPLEQAMRKIGASGSSM